MSDKEKNTKSVVKTIFDAIMTHQMNKLGKCSYELDDMRREAAKKNKK